MNADLVLREFPQATVVWLRYQVGRVTMKPVRCPVLDMEKHIIGWKSSEKEVYPAFNLLGCGETREEAEAMAARTLRRL